MSETIFPSGTLLRLLGERARQSAALHRQFLHSRGASMETLRALMEAQMANGLPEQASPPQPAAVHNRALFSSQQLDEFGRGSIANCLGPAFTRYEGQRIPRIPNGDLKMMSRIVAINGTPRDLTKPASVTAEYDVPPDAWYFHESGSFEMPASFIMEAALQPCGFLSAYLDTYAFAPYTEFFFRNLDGSLHFLDPLDLRGKTITTHARMLSSVAGGGTIIQSFAFEMSCSGRPICAGESTFGYFSGDTMKAQVGLDGGQQALPLLRTAPGLAQKAAWLDVPQLQAAPTGANRQAQPQALRLPEGRFHFLDDIAVLPEGGRYGHGYVYARRPVNPDDWFYPFHFYQDPVMPGSLGVEAVIEAGRAFVLSLTGPAGAIAGLRAPRFGRAALSPAMTWRYRGQITPQNKLMELEIHFHAAEWRNGQVVYPGDASLWVDGLRIYEVKNLTIGVLES